MHMPPPQVLLPTLFYLAVHVRASEAGESSGTAGLGSVSAPSTSTSRIDVVVRPSGTRAKVVLRSAQ